MTCDNGLCISNHEWIKLRMKTPIYFNNKGNEVIAWCSFGIRLCLFVSNHPCCMCYHHQCSLHHICANQVNNENVHQNIETIFKNNIHLLSNVVREKVGNLPLNMCSTFQSNGSNNISKCVVGWCMFTTIKAPKQMGT